MTDVERAPSKTPVRRRRRRTIPYPFTMLRILHCQIRLLAKPSLPDHNFPMVHSGWQYKKPTKPCDISGFTQKSTGLKIDDMIQLYSNGSTIERIQSLTDLESDGFEATSCKLHYDLTSVVQVGCKDDQNRWRQRMILFFLHQNLKNRGTIPATDWHSRSTTALEYTCKTPRVPEMQGVSGSDMVELMATCKKSICWGSLTNTPCCCWRLKSKIFSTESLIFPELHSKVSFWGT